jgi:hypothetical protein
MPWQDVHQIRDLFLSKYDGIERNKIAELYAFHAFLDGALLAKGASIESQFEKAIAISEYGRKILSHLDLSSYSERQLVLACALVFFHQEFLIDIANSDPVSALAMLGDELASERIWLPDRYGRTLYDRFNSLSDKGRIDFLEASDVDVILQGTEQGRYQVGFLVAGPLGIVRSEEDRHIPPTRRIPLWHCSDPGCQRLHSVNLLRHDDAIYDLADRISEVAVNYEGQESEWEKSPVG